MNKNNDDFDELKEEKLYIPKELLDELERLTKDIGNSFDFDWEPLPESDCSGCSGGCSAKSGCNSDNCEKSCDEECKNSKNENIYCKCDVNQPKENWALGKKFYVCKKCGKEID